MADKEITQLPNSSCTIPKWGPKKGIRYEVDDFIVSPPSNEDGGFFQLRYGQRPKPRPSTYDRINKELSMTVKIEDGDHVISDVPIPPGLSEKSLSTPEVSVTTGGLSPTKTLESTIDTSSVVSTKPLFVFHFGDYKKTEKAQQEEEEQQQQLLSSQSDPNIVQSSTTSVVDIQSSVPRPQSYVEPTVAVNDPPIKEEIPRQPEDESQPIKNKSRPTRISDGNLMEKVRNLQVKSPVESTPFTSPFATPLNTPLTTPASSPTPKRKISGVMMDQSAQHSYFCTKPFQKTSENSFASSDVSLSATSSHMTQQLETSTKTGLSMEPDLKNSFMGKKRRPKPSSLREMNFWAPTSM